MQVTELSRGFVGADWVIPSCGGPTREQGVQSQEIGCWQRETYRRLDGALGSERDDRVIWALGLGA